MMIGRKQRTLRVSLVFGCLIWFTGVAAAQEKEPVVISAVGEFSGGGAVIWDYFWKGVQLARDEINAKGGILGRPIKITFYDTQSDPPTSVSAVKRALAQDKPYAVVGPLYTGSTIVNMAETQAAKVPHLVGSEGWTVTTKGNPYIFRSSENNRLDVIKILRWLVEEKKIKRAALIFRTDEYGTSSKDAMLAYLKEKGVTVDPVIGVDVRQKDYTAELLKVKAAKVDALLENPDVGEAAILRRQFNKLGLQMIHYGQNACDPAFLELAKTEADGMFCHTGFIPTSPDERSKTFVERFRKKWNKDPSEEAYKGYNATYMVKVITEQIKEFNQEKFVQKLHNFYLAPEIEPNLLPAYWDENGDYNFRSHIATIKNGKYEIIGRVPPFKGPGSGQK
ncbi:MAG: hypothetical protein A3G35_00910 [candidate division NC10 bacterium RIFCSPLOWO2_12_FULL_66_18]|nr:MAG: hypothetical protein A3H39_20335 [candidate division NC10 bacterium RIFCSPLOWO2_02_FULL_66_22]OGB97473.1 MAG: hypothetical protein A3G35_00910 [candidate division NC10 bacterium RIFCSPLOWO2_12_FULL_66_18]